MKKILLLLLLFVGFTSINAQTKEELLTQKDLESYVEDAKSNNIEWTK